MRFLHHRFTDPRLQALALSLALAGRVLAASSTTVALLGDPAPGGGVFAGPGFTGWPSAGGDGWVAFRGEVSGGATSEAMVVARMVSPVSRTQVASIGQPAPGGGTFKEFLARPAVNAHGDVAFLAQLTHGDDQGDDTGVGTPAGIFLFHDGNLTVIARSGDPTNLGTLDLLAPADPNADPTDIVERTPALNDARDVAFLAAVQTDARATGAIFVARAGEGPTPAVRLGERYDGGAFTTLGPPALNGSRLVAFHGMVTTPDDPDGVLDGIFTAGPDGAPAQLKVGEGAPVVPLNEKVHVFGDDVALNDAGDAVFFAGPLSADSTTVETLDDSPGIVRCSGGVLTPVAYPGLHVGKGVVTSFRLGPAAGSTLVPPLITPTGDVGFLASLDGGNREVIAVWNGLSFRTIYTGGIEPDATPAGGVYAGASSAPALDANGALAFRARMAGGVTSEALVFQPAVGTGTVTVVGDAAPTTGFFAGEPFSAPVMNDGGDVVFRAFLARGSASVGIFRRHDGALSAVVRSGDPAPGAGTFLDLLGEPSVNQPGAVAFAALTSDRDAGIYVASTDGMRAVVSVGDAVPGEADTTFKSISQNPALNDAGAVAFRATTSRQLPDSDTRIGSDGIFLADGTGIRRLVKTNDPSPAGSPFFKLRDPTLTNIPSVAFRASLGETRETSTGVFVADANGVRQIALEDDDLGSGNSLARVTGDPIGTSNGDLAFIANRSRLVTDSVHKSLGPSILYSAGDSLGLVIAQDMPGPAGGTFRNLSQPAVNAAGHVAFRGSFLPATGGTGGIFLSTETGIEPFLTLGDNSPAGGKFTSFGSRVALDGSDDIAFTATVSQGSARTGVFVASRTRLLVRPLVIRLGRPGHDRVKVTASLRLGRLTDGITPGKEPVTLSVSDAHGVLWSINANGGQFKGRGGDFVATPRPSTTLGKHLRSIRVRTNRDGGAVVTAVSAPVDLIGASRTLEAPIAVSLQVGDDGGTRVLPCRPGRRGLRCRL